MKKRKQFRKSNAKAAVQREKPCVEAPAVVSASKPAGPPLAGEALELKVADKLCEDFRATEARKALQAACNGADADAIEAAILSPRVRSIVEPVSRAFSFEHAVAILRATFCKARRALETDKPTPAELTALKIIIQVFIEKMLERIEAGFGQEAFSLLGFSDHEKSLIENMIQLVRGQRAPLPEAPLPAPDVLAFAETGE